MTTALALEYIPRRMKELGYGSEYILRFRHFVLQPGERREIDAYNQFYILVEELADVIIDSEFGSYDLTDQSSNEQSYEHQGEITIVNVGRRVNHLRFIQVIPKNILTS